MEDKHFLDAYNLINECLVHLKMDRTFNSIGSNVFFEFGKEKIVVHPNGRKYAKKEWGIWLSLTSWRINKGDKYIVGSGDDPQTIQSNIQQLLGKRFQSLSFLSQFLDVEFTFEDGYQITTFFNWMEEDQWTIFLPDDSNIGVDCSSKEAITQVQELATHFQIPNNYQKLDSPLKGKRMLSIINNKNDMPIFHFDEDYTLNLEACAWRLEHNNDYVIGCLDDNSSNNEELNGLIGRKVERIDIANPMMDARIQFEDGFVLKTFSCCHIEEQWKIYEEKKLIFCAKIPLLDNHQPI